MESLVNSILECVKQQSVLDKELQDLQKQADKIQATRVKLAGKIEAYLEVYKQQTGKDFNELVNSDVGLAEALRVAAQAGQTQQETNTEPVSAPPPKPTIVKHQSNKRLEPTVQTEELQTSGRTRMPSIKVTDGPPTIEDDGED